MRLDRLVSSNPKYQAAGIAGFPLPCLEGEALDDDDGEIKHRGEDFPREQSAVLITGFSLLHGFTLDGARMLLECGEVKE